MNDPQLVHSLRANAQLHREGTITAAAGVLDQAADELERSQEQLLAVERWWWHGVEVDDSGFYTVDHDTVDEAMTNIWAALIDPEALPEDRRMPRFALNAAHLERQRTFSAATFGPGPRLAGVLDHIRKELGEVEAQPSDVSEWADVIILAFDGALRQGIEPQDILDAILAKQTRNESREWPDWRTADPNKAIEHVRSEQA